MTFGLDRRLAGRTARKAWARARAERLDVLRVLARFPLSTEQARRAYDLSRRPSGLTDDRLVEDPYLLFEADRRHIDAISLGMIDRGLFPRDSGAQASLDAHPLPEPVDEAADDRRVRAGAIAVLDSALDEGHTVLHEQELRTRIATLRLKPACDPGDAAWEIAVDELAPSLVAARTASGERAWQLAEAALVSALVRDEIAARLDMGPLPDDVAWEARLEDIGLEDDGTATEAEARGEKVAALSVLARSRISCLVGPAGTGKTTLLDALCGHPDIQAAGVLLLAPTGKARVQLAARVEGTALTLAQFLSRTGRFDGDRYLVLGAECTKLGGWDTVVVADLGWPPPTRMASKARRPRRPPGADMLLSCDASHGPRHPQCERHDTAGQAGVP